MQCLHPYGVHAVWDVTILDFADRPALYRAWLLRILVSAYRAADARCETASPLTRQGARSKQRTPRNGPLDEL